MNKYTAQQSINEKITQMQQLEQEIVALALEHQIPVSLGEDRQGQRWLILTDEEGEYNFKKAGDWMTSTESCN